MFSESTNPIIRLFPHAVCILGHIFVLWRVWGYMTRSSDPDEDIQNFKRFQTMLQDNDLHTEPSQVLITEV